MSPLPTELVNRIITIGCEELPNNYSNFTQFKPRSLKEFARTASTVCREWRALVLSPSNYHLWSTHLALSRRRITSDTFEYGCDDIAMHISRFTDMLSNSRLSDLDLSLVFPVDDKLAESLMVHLLALIAPYSRQVRSFILHSHPLRKIVSVLQNMQPLPRLARFILYFSSEELLDQLDDVFSFRPGSLTLDLSTGINCRDVDMGTWAFTGGIILPINSISTLSIRFDKTDVCEWRAIAMLLEAQPFLTSLSFTSLVLRDTPTSSSGTGSVEACLPHLHTLAMHSDISSTLTLMAHLSLPHLASLDLSMYSFESNLHKVKPSDIILSRLVRLRHLQLDLFEKTWTTLHDYLIQAMLPPRLEKLTVNFNERISKCCTLILPCVSERPVVANFQFYTCSHQRHLAALLSRWNPEKMQVEFVGTTYTIFRPLFTSREAVNALVAMEKLHTLWFDGGGANGLLCFLAQYETPELRTIKVGIHRPQLIVHPTSADSKTVWNKVYEVSIVFHFFRDLYEPDITPFLTLFPSIHFLGITLNCTYDAPRRLDLLFRPLESGVFAVKQILELTVHVYWRYRWDRSQAEASSQTQWQELKRHLVAGIRHSLSRVVQHRSVRDFPPLKARLFVTDEDAPPGPKENELIWSYGSTSPDDDVLRESRSH